MDFINNNITQLKEVFLNVRKAYRLLYVYQRRVMDIMQFIESQTGRPYQGGWSKFSLSSPKDGKGSLDNWAWDWLNMYCYEFYFGDKVIDKDTIKLSVWVVSDTGYFDAGPDYESRVEVEKFSTVEDSETKLIFVVGKNIWHNEFGDFSTSESLRKESTELVRKEGKGVLLAKSFPLLSFTNEDMSRKSLQEFASFCRGNEIEMTIMNE